MSRETISIKGARVHNLKNISLEIPKYKLVVISGMSGSGKSSLAFDTLYAEGRRRYIESLSSYARQFMGQIEKPDVDQIDGLSPAIAIDQKALSHNPRSTVGTVTEIYDYLRLLFARAGVPHCPQCGKVIQSQTIDQIIEHILGMESGTQAVIMAPLIEAKKGHHKDVLYEIDRQGFVRVRINGAIMLLEQALQAELERYKQHTIEVVVDRLVIPSKSLSENDYKEERLRVADSVETALKIGNGRLIVQSGEKPRDHLYSASSACPTCGISMPELTPKLFSFNSPQGACPECHGIGFKLELDPDLVVPEKDLTIAEGALRPWASASHRVGRQSYLWSRLRDVCDFYSIPLNTSWQQLSKRHQEILLYGGDDPIQTEWSNRPFEGVITQLKRRYNETDSDGVRQEIERYMVEMHCEVCDGKRLKTELLAVRFHGKNIDEVTALSITNCYAFFDGIKYDIETGASKSLTDNQQLIALPVLKELVKRLSFLTRVGVEYLTLARRSTTLSGGESQRINLATQIGSGLSGVLYILDEPSIGLHQRDQDRLVHTLKNLRDLGNTVIVVEHDRQTIEAADWLVDIGPGGGKKGGTVVFTGTPEQIKKSKGLTGKHLADPSLAIVRRADGNAAASKVARASTPISKPQTLTLSGATHHNLKNVTVEIPLGKLITVTGVSGSGKSSLILDTLARAMNQHLYHAKAKPGEFKKLTGTEYIDRLVDINQSPIGRTPRSNPATYTGIFDLIRTMYAQTNEARVRGYQPGRFSFNVKSGRCEACQGQGVNRIEMQLLPDVYVTCDVCKGTRYQKEVLEVHYNGKHIAEVLEMEIAEAHEFFKNIPQLKRRLGLLNEIGLDYIELGQPAPTLSGGEAQRIKLAKELTQFRGKHTLYILDEPTTGLHFEDTVKLLKILHQLVEQGNTVLLIEHNLDVIASSDWIIDLGPDGGDAGGYIIATGTPSEIAREKKSYTGQYLRKMLLGV
ncbi:MAG: UvrABC system protein A [Parcubacteria group bacterium GW2011_GWA2_47_8]|nr:MAG: UvrABC system protein A [Parcubacteria group bacterium GW2011_GWA2_47_8]OHB18434.1 MAG: excinuclease ABC subunit A [Parcubacteria group bacterium RIFCSPHIGHO2_01_FULL_47_10b]